MTLIIDSFMLLVICVVCILRLNEQKHNLLRTLLWSCAVAGTFGLGCEQIARGRVFGPDMWPIMMHMGLAGLLVLRFACLHVPEEERRHVPDRRIVI